MITSFACFKVLEKTSEKSPDYKLTAKVGEEYVECGAGWVKEGKNGKYISFQLAKPYQDKPGFEIVPLKGVPLRTIEAGGNQPGGVEYPDGPDPSSIPF